MAQAIITIQFNRRRLKDKGQAHWGSNKAETN